MNYEEENNEEGLINDPIPSNNESEGTESTETDGHSEDWDPLQDDDEVSTDDPSTIEDGEDDGTEENEPLEDDDDSVELDTDESTGNAGL